MPRFKKSIAIDFDGVLHAYTSPWTKASEVRDGPTPGALEAVKEYIMAGYNVVVYSARANDPDGEVAMHQWLQKHGFPVLHIATEKPHAELYIDDRGFQFIGDWPSIEYISSFRPWNKRLANELRKVDNIIAMGGPATIAEEVEALHRGILRGMAIPPELMTDETQEKAQEVQQGRVQDARCLVCGDTGFDFNQSEHLIPCTCTKEKEE
ncbi:MAG: hypothetical protein WC372_10565 [Candidatus Neomarinimicrobiota bacterium]|jgi:hypothetical protein